MFDSTRTVAVTLAVLTVVGFGIAPMAAVATPSEDTNTAYQLDGTQLDDGLSTQANSSGPFPQEVCTDLQGMIHEQAPYDMLVWVDDLPSDAQPPGVPWSVITPGSIAGIVVGATPNQCEVFDPNDPPYDPIQDDDDNFAPDGGGDVQQGDDGRVLFIVNGTLDNTSEGPSVEGTAGLDLAENGTLDPEATLNDGEKEYGVAPELKYWSDGTTYFETDVFVFGTRVGVVEDCTGPECTFSTRGLPNFVEYPAIPSHTDSDPDAGSGGDGDSGSGDTGGDDGESGSDDGTDDGTGGTGTDGTSGDGTDGAGGSGSGDDSGGTDGTTETDDGTGSGAGTGGSGDETGADGSGSSDGGQSDGGNGGDGGQTGGDSSNQQQATQSGDGGDQGAQQAAAADGSGLGVVVAMVVFILGAAAIAPRD